MTTGPAPNRAQALCQTVYRHLDSGDIRRAGPVCEQLVAEFPDFAPGWAAFGELWQRVGEPERAVECVKTACRLAPDSAAYQAQLARCELQRGDTRRAMELAETALEAASDHYETLDTIGNIFSSAGDQGRAMAIFERAYELAPDHPAAIYNLATSLRFHGRVDEAEPLFERLIELDPDDHEAVHARSLLHRASVEHNHIASLEKRLAANPPWPAASHYAYALGKEYDDLGEYAKSFAAYSRGAGLLHAHRDAGLEGELECIDTVVTALERGIARPDGPGHDSDEPVFVIGLPRTGSTLIERILGGHDAVFAAGELHNFQTQARRITGAPTVETAYRAAAEQPARIDFAALGRAYIDSTRPRTGHTARFIDKLPRNDLWAGLIHRALPRARFILTRRDPMDTGYALYRTLFRSGYAFTFDLDTLGRYIRAHDRLVAALVEALPASALKIVEYEDLVAEPEHTARGLVEFIGLDWQPDCLAFDQREEAVVTASAHQVRQPIYTSSVGKWRHVEGQLEPLARWLQPSSD